MTAEERLHLHLAQSIQRGREPLAVLVAPHRNRQPRVICAWCRVVMSEGTEPTSHGCCRVCAPRIMQEAEHG